MDDRLLDMDTSKVIRRIFTASLLIATGIVLTGCASHQSAKGNARQAQSIILFIGDGMGVSTVTAARIFDGQARGLDGESHYLEFEKFPNVALVKTYNTNQQVPDSAGTATAIMTGEKTRAGVISIGPDVLRRTCVNPEDSRLATIVDAAQRHGMAAGFVTTTRVTHATPATTYAHSSERGWESDRFLSDEFQAAGCRDIAFQLLNPDRGRGLDVAMGGGAREFFGTDHGGMRRQPQADLVTRWLAGGERRQYISNREELSDLEPGSQVLGLFADSHMTYVAERSADTHEPMLSDMTAAAIDHLEGIGDGYFLLVEGGRIDHGHHDGKPGYAMTEAREFNRALKVALDRVDIRETLILVTADHSHVFTMGGYPVRGNPILGLVRENDVNGEPQDEYRLAADGQPFTTVGYANGPGAVSGHERPRPETGIDALAQSLIPLEKRKLDGTISDSETHGGEDVALYARGPMSHLVGGVIEQNEIFNIMLEAIAPEMPRPSPEAESDREPARH